MTSVVIGGSSTDSRPFFETSRLRCEPVESRHARAMVEVLADAKSHRYLSSEPPTLAQLEEQYRFLTAGKSPDGREHWLTWIVVRIGGEQPIGFVQATIREPETVHIAYFLAPSAWGKGYASEAVEAMLDVVFERYQVERAIAEMDTRNEASIRLVERLGLQRTALVEDADHFKGESSDEYVYELSCTSWMERHQTPGSADLEEGVGG